MKDMCMRNDRGEWLFYDEVDSSTVFFTLTDRYGNALRGGELPLSLALFTRIMEKAGWQRVGELFIK